MLPGGSYWQTPMCKCKSAKVYGERKTTRPSGSRMIGKVDANSYGEGRSHIPVNDTKHGTQSPAHRQGPEEVQTLSISSRPKGGSIRSRAQTHASVRTNDPASRPCAERVGGQTWPAEYPYTSPVTPKSEQENKHTAEPTASQPAKKY